MTRSPDLRVRIANRRTGGLWWRAPTALAVWLVLIAPAVIVAVGVVILRQYVADLPRVPDLDTWDVRAPRTSEIRAADGTVLADIPFRDGALVGHRWPVDFDELPERLVQAILAAEDVRFFDHTGVDTQAVVRAAWANHRAGRVVQGASTITQQVARNVLPAIGDERTFRRKVREALMARRIEEHFSKRRIFEVYANHAFLGAGAYGVAAAARAYFDRELAHLELHELALIAGLFQAPGRADPYKDPIAAKARRDEVLGRMARAGFIDERTARAAAARPIELRPPAVHYGALAPWYTERVRREVQDTWPEAYARGGLRVEAAVWPGLSLEAEGAARENALRLAEGGADLPQVGAVVWDHRTDYVEATVGGLSFVDSQFDRALSACRQPGSAFKPVVYAAAIEADAITSGTPLRDAPVVEYDEDRDVHWKPSSAGHAFRGVALAGDALAASLNAPAIDVFDRVGGARVIDLARRLGIHTELTDLRPLALGASCVKPIELAAAYATLARGGVFGEPIFTVRVSRVGADGLAVLVDRASPYDPTLSPARRLDRLADRQDQDQPPTRVRALDPVSAFLMTTMMAAVIERGTATAARALGRPLAGKTGTTNGNTDAWFAGFSARLTAVVWVGHDRPDKGLGRRRDGARAALPLWMRLVELAEGARPAAPLTGTAPPGVVRARIDRETGLLADPGASGSVPLYFRQGTEPTERASHIPGVPADLSRVSREF